MLKQQPHDANSEAALLAQCLIDSTLAADVSSKLSTAHFSVHEHKIFFDAFAGLAAAGVTVEEAAVVSKLEELGCIDSVGGAASVYELAATAGVSSNAKHYIAQLQDMYTRRQIIETCDWVEESAADKSLDVLQVFNECASRLMSIDTARENARPFTAKELALNEGKHIEIRREKGNTAGVKTGFTDLDNMTGGLQPQEMIVVGARPAMGKTALALNIALHAGTKGRTESLLFSLEMSKESLFQRLLCIDGGIDSQRLRTGQLKDNEWSRYTASMAKLHASKIAIDDRPGLTVFDIAATARKHKITKGLGLVVVDYMQLMGTPRTKNQNNRERDIAEMSCGLKSLARELNIPVVVLSQLNRAVEGREDKRPRLADLRESGAIEQDADLVTMLYRDDHYNEDSKDPGIAEIIIAKNRNGPTGKIKLQWVAQHVKFQNQGWAAINKEGGEL